MSISTMSDSTPPIPHWISVCETRVVHDAEKLAHDRRDEEWWRFACLTTIQVSSGTGDSIGAVYSTAELLRETLASINQLQRTGRTSVRLGDDVSLSMKRDGNSVLASIDVEVLHPFMQIELSESEALFTLAALLCRVFDGAAQIGVNFSPYIRTYA